MMLLRRITITTASIFAVVIGPSDPSPIDPECAVKWPRFVQNLLCFPAKVMEVAHKTSRDDRHMHVTPTQQIPA
jgi:hypothetical protein